MLRKRHLSMSSFQYFRLHFHTSIKNKHLDTLAKNKWWIFWFMWPPYYRRFYSHPTLSAFEISDALSCYSLDLCCSKCVLSCRHWFFVSVFYMKCDSNYSCQGQPQEGGMTAHGSKRTCPCYCVNITQREDSSHTVEQCRPIQAGLEHTIAY